MLLVFRDKCMAPCFMIGQRWSTTTLRMILFSLWLSRASLMVPVIIWMFSTQCRALWSLSIGQVFGWWGWTPCWTRFMLFGLILGRGCNEPPVSSRHQASHNKCNFFFFFVCVCRKVNMTLYSTTQLDDEQHASNSRNNHMTT
jgi:hypothetical protein